MKVKCPKCGTEREVKGTENRVRCPSKKGCGERYYVFPNIVLQEDIKEDKKEIVGTIKPKPLEFNGTVKTLIIALNYAINTIKNKKQVKEKDVNSTWFQYYKEWSRIRKYFQALEEEKIK